MVRVLLLVLVLAMLAPLVLDSTRSSRVQVERHAITVETADLRARFERDGRLDDTYMLFGGIAIDGRNALSDVGVSGLALRHVQHMSARYPDFTSCKSPGANSAKRLVEEFDFVSEGSAVGAALRDAVERHDDAIRNGGERICLRVSGERMSFESVHALEDDTDLTPQFGRHLRRRPHVLVREATVKECREFL